ncbi:MAG: hypothetical protein QOF11_2704 [Chloroflexota bacterium]|nr:hypothetical protein [Chloroflexota bacterium]
MVDVKVEVRGIRELNSAFKAVDAGLSRELKAAFWGIANAVVGKIQQRMPHDHGDAAGSVKPRATAKGAGIAFGGTKAPYMPWLDFGGSVGRGHVPGQAWSGAIKRDWLGVPSGEGRYVYPAISEERGATAAAVDEAIAKVAKHAGFETTGSGD